MRFARNAKIFRGQIDAAPAAGVFFLLVIFVLLQSSLVVPPGVRIQLPAAGEMAGPTTATVTLAVDASGLLFFDHQVIREDALRARLAAAVATAGEPLTLVLQADQSVKNETLTRLFAVAREVGIRDALLATRPPVLTPPARPRASP